MVVITHEKMLEAQYAIIGSMLIEPLAVGEIIAEVKPLDFTDTMLRHIFDCCREIYFEHHPVDVITISSKLTPDIPGVGTLLMDIMQITPTAANWKAYAEIMKEQALIVRAQTLGHELAVVSSKTEAVAIADKMSQLYAESPDTEGVSFSMGLESFYKRHSGGRQADKYLRWGFSALNENLYAKPGHFVIIGGYSSTGKTALALSMAWTMATENKKRIGVFSLETDDEDIYDRLICRLTGVNFDEINKGLISSESWKLVDETQSYRETVVFDVHRSSGMTAQDIKAISLSKHYDVIFIDYLQLIETPTKSTRAEEVAGISRALHTFAQRSKTTVVALSQLSRPEKNANTAPEMSSLRESGQLEQDADIIMLLYLKDKKRLNGPRILKIAKNKKGVRGDMTLEFDAKHMRFLPQSRLDDEAPPQKSRFRELPPVNPQEIMEVFSNGDSECL